MIRKARRSARPPTSAPTTPRCPWPQDSGTTYRTFRMKTGIRPWAKPCDKRIYWSFKMPGGGLSTDARFRSLLTASKQVMYALRWHPVDEPAHSPASLRNLFRALKPFIAYLASCSNPVLQFRTILPIITARTTFSEAAVFQCLGPGNTSMCRSCRRSFNTVAQRTGCTQLTHCRASRPPRSLEGAPFVWEQN